MALRLAEQTEESLGFTRRPIVGGVPDVLSIHSANPVNANPVIQTVRFLGPSHPDV